MRFHEILREFNEAKILNDFGAKLYTQVFKTDPLWYRQVSGAPTREAPHSTNSGYSDVKQEDDTHYEVYAKKFIDAIAAFDPTPNKELTFWLINNYANGRIKRIEDIPSKAVPALLKYKTLLRKPNLRPPLQKRDINQIQGYGELQDILDKYEAGDALSNSEKDAKLEKDLVEAGFAKIIRNDIGFKVVIPEVERAARELHFVFSQNS